MVKVYITILSVNGKEFGKLKRRRLSVQKVAKMFNKPYCKLFAKFKVGGRRLQREAFKKIVTNVTLHLDGGPANKMLTLLKVVYEFHFRPF